MTRSKNSKAKPKKRHHKNLEASLNEMDQDVENLVSSCTKFESLVTQLKFHNCLAMCHTFSFDLALQMFCNEFLVNS